MKVKLTAEECKESIYDLEVFVSNPEDALIGKCGTLKHTEKNISLVTNGLGNDKLIKSIKQMHLIIVGFLQWLTLQIKFETQKGH